MYFLWGRGVSRCWIGPVDCCLKCRGSSQSVVITSVAPIESVGIDITSSLAPHSDRAVWIIS